jgi:predicted nucleotidyltransferase
METGRISIADALFTKSQQRVLALLYGMPQRSFYLNEIVRHADMGRGAVSRELSKLCLAGLITVSPKGNQNHYQANPDNPVFDDLLGIVMKTVGLADVIARELEGILNREETDFAFIYGSIAKNEERWSSDVDLMVIASGFSYSEVMPSIQAAELELGRTVNLTLLTPEEFGARKAAGQSFLARVLEQPKIWLKGGP